MKKRSSILFYFDNYHLVSSLADEQLGLLFRALMEYGEREVNGEGVNPADFPRRYPAMGEMTRAYFAFMADTIRRDAAVYNEKRANYCAAAQKREAEKAHARETRDSGSAAYVPRPAPKPKPDPAWDYVP